MLDALTKLFAPALLERLTLLLNHVLSSEAAAMERLRAHAGRSFELTWAGWPGFLPAPPPMAWRVTPIGLLERVDAPAACDLRMTLDVGDPLKLAATLAAGERPSLAIEGDAGFATDIGWLTENLRWDIEDDLARLIGDLPARGLARFGRAIASQVAAAARALAERRGAR